MLTPNDIEKKLLESFPDAQIKAYDLTGGGDHWQVRMTAKEFTGLRLVQQHQLVYKALGSWMYKEIHALSLDTKAPE